MIERETFDTIVKVVIAQLSTKSGFADIEHDSTLRDLGFKDDAGIAEIKTRAYRSVSGTDSPVDFEKFSSWPGITLDAKVSTIVEAAFTAFLSALPGDNPTKPH